MSTIQPAVLRPSTILVMNDDRVLFCQRQRYNTSASIPNNDMFREFHSDTHVRYYLQAFYYGSSTLQGAHSEVYNAQHSPAYFTRRIRIYFINEFVQLDAGSIIEAIPVEYTLIFDQNITFNTEQLSRPQVYNSNDISVELNYRDIYRDHGQIEISGVLVSVRN